MDEGMLDRTQSYRHATGQGGEPLLLWFALRASSVDFTSACGPPTSPDTCGVHERSAIICSHVDVVLTLRAASVGRVECMQSRVTESCDCGLSIRGVSVFECIVGHAVTSLPQ